eukprot:COSAG06_NODE_1472_length_9346_cov_5.895750_4_plen_135_part_00
MGWVASRVLTPVGCECAACVQGLKKYLSDPASALTDSAAHMKDAITGTPVEPIAKQLAEASGQEEGLVMVGCVVLGLFIGLFIIGAVNIVTAAGFAVPAYSTLQLMKQNAEKAMMEKMIPVSRSIPFFLLHSAA